jgi:hypothetical protein
MKTVTQTTEKAAAGPGGSAPGCCGLPMIWCKRVIDVALDVATRITSDVYQCGRCRQLKGVPRKYHRLTKPREASPDEQAVSA